MSNYIANLIDNYENGTNLYKIISIPEGNDCGTIVAHTKEEAIIKWENSDDPIPYSNNTKYDLTDDGKGKKYDDGKSMVGTLCRVFPRALLAIGKCIEFGTRKYPKPDNWCLVENGEQRYLDSLMRHLLKHLSGQEVDNETGLPHLYHACWNMLAITEFYLKRNRELDEGLFK